MPFKKKNQLCGDLINGRFEKERCMVYHVKIKLMKSEKDLVLGRIFFALLLILCEGDADIIKCMVWFDLVVRLTEKW